MKKLFESIILSAVLLTGAAAVAPSASAEWSGWQNESGYSGRVFTDAATYTTGASTVDWKAEKKGAETLYYTAGVYKKRSGGGLTDTNLVQRGSFKTATPLKSFNVKTIWNKTGKGTYVIQLDCYSDSGKRNYIGTSESAKFYVK
ncbi:hypothetical protein PWO55_08965 [Bacillus velezensis]|uniref:hypothetical protein n=1 Tax=Bacillus TaxID=1386 RepID=UPI00066FD97A|nr:MULTISPECIES: hypothetical protein [Bacillus]QSZ44858.1 hypothetical protein I3J23_19230 [Bacillus amyloliquefaciens]UXZ16091.1 hypothetical protein KI431_09430 [Bacillus siamensis]WFR90248.1 hypothetical protein P9972_09520 [Bacillus velezensis]